MWSTRKGVYEVLIIGVASVLILLLTMAAQRMGVAQPWAMAIAVGVALLAVYPFMLRHQRANVPISHWALAVAAIVAVSLFLHLLLLRV